MSRTSLGRLGLMFVSLLGLMALFSASAFAAGNPLVTTSAATNKTFNFATLNGTVNPNGDSTTYKFEYGHTTAYGKSTTVTSAGGGSTPVAVKAVVGGLEPGTTYHFRVSATNGWGTALSADMTLEMKIQWKANGKPASEYSSAPWLALPGAGQLPVYHLVGEGTSGGGTVVKITCSPPNPELGESGWSYGDFKTNYHFPYVGCKTFLNGKESKPCTNSSYTGLDLNSGLVPTKGAIIYLGEECAIGEEFSIAGAFTLTLGSSEELSDMPVTLTQKSQYLTFTISSTWHPSGILTGMKIGVS
jgi:hypothetical protein